MNALYMSVNLRPDPAAVQEVNVLTGTYSAQYGNYLGVHINEVTKSGTNQLHGSFSEDAGNTALNANTFDFSAKPIAKEPYHFNQFNTELGGPVLIPGVYNGKDKTFFMFDYQGLRNLETPTDTYTVMTPLMRQGNCTELLPSTTLTDVYDPSCVSGNIIAPTCASPVAQQFLKVIPLPNVGFAYPVTNSWVVRGGFGIFYNPNQTNSYTLLDTNPPMSEAATAVLGLYPASQTRRRPWHSPPREPTATCHGTRSLVRGCGIWISRSTRISGSGSVLISSFGVRSLTSSIIPASPRLVDRRVPPRSRPVRRLVPLPSETSPRWPEPIPRA